MATIIHLSPIQTPPPSPRLFSSQTTPHFSFNLHPKPLSFPSISLRPYAPAKPGALVVTWAVKSLSETELVPVDGEEVAGKLPSETGVYAVFDENGELAASVLVHRKSVPELCHSVKVGIVDEPDRTVLTEAWKSWMEEHIKATGKVPPGNESGNATWVRQAPKKSITRVQEVPRCVVRVIGILENQRVDYESVDVLDEEYNSGLRESLKSYSNWPTFPQIFVNGELVGGCDILTSMHEKGELASLFKK